jgi:hypothetical protein
LVRDLDTLLKIICIMAGLGIKKEVVKNYAGFGKVASAVRSTVSASVVIYCPGAQVIKSK